VWHHNTYSYHGTTISDQYFLALSMTRHPDSQTHRQTGLKQYHALPLYRWSG